MEPQETVQRFIEAWNAESDEQRQRLLALCCRPDAEFSNPQSLDLGAEALSGAIGAFRRTFPRAVVVHGPADEHHGYVRFRWETRWNDGRDLLFGEDFAELDSDGRIKRLVSFNGIGAAV